MSHLPVANLRPLFVLMTVKSISKLATFSRPSSSEEVNTSKGHIPLCMVPAEDQWRPQPKSVSPLAFLTRLAVSTTAFRLGRLMITERLPSYCWTDISLPIEFLGALRCMTGLYIQAASGWRSVKSRNTSSNDKYEQDWYPLQATQTCK